MKNTKLDNLKSSGQIIDYSLHKVSEDGIVGKTSEFRNTEMLLIKFPNGESLCINTICSGCAENTYLLIK